MRFMSLVRSAENLGPPPQALMEAIDRGSQEPTATVQLIMTGGLGPSSMGTRVRVKGRKIVVTDGPFTETKEVVGGFAVLETATREEAIAGAKWLMQMHLEHWPQWEGEVEIRQIFAGP